MSLGVHMIPIVIAAPPGPLLDALQSFLRAQPEIVLVAIASDVDRARQAACRPEVEALVLDLALAEERTLELIAWLHQTRPLLRSIALAENRPQQRLSLAAGAHRSLLKGCLDEDLVAALRGEGEEDR